MKTGSARVVDSIACLNCKGLYPMKSLHWKLIIGEGL